MGGQPYQPFAVEQRAAQKDSGAEKNPFADPGWANATAAPTHNTTAWQDVHLDHANAGEAQTNSLIPVTCISRGLQLIR